MCVWLGLLDILLELLDNLLLLFIWMEILTIIIIGRELLEILLELLDKWFVTKIKQLLFYTSQLLQLRPGWQRELQKRPSFKQLHLPRTQPFLQVHFRNPGPRIALFPVNIILVVQVGCALHVCNIHSSPINFAVAPTIGAR